MLVAAHGEVESHLQDAFYLRTVVDIGIISLLIVLILLTEVHATCQLADDDEVSSLDKFFLQRTLMEKAVESSHRSHIGEEAQLLTHGEESCLRTHFQRGVVVEARITDSSEEHSICIHAGLEGLIREWVATCIDSMGTADSLLVFKLMAKLLCHDIEDIDSLRHDLRTDSVAREYSNFQFHNIFTFYFSSSIMLSILMVAWIAASVWSASRPRVRNCFCPSFQEMTVCTRASVRPPGGIVTA